MQGGSGAESEGGMKTGSLFSGYAGLDAAVNEMFGAETAWFSEFDKGPSKILAHRFPGVPNHGDITKIDWSTVEPVDILTGGSPCQDLSHAGKRAGMTEGTRSNLWVAMREAIAALRPSLVVWENVRGAASAEAASDLEFCPGCMGDPRHRGTPLRALGRVVGDLADLGYVGRVRGLRAADVGAPHGRFRYFLAAEPSGLRRGAGWPAVAREAEGGWASADIAGRGLLPTPRATDGTKGGPNQRGSSGDLMLPSAVMQVLPTPSARDWKDHTIRREPHRPDDVDTLARALTVTLLPTPAVNDMGAAYTPDEWDAWCEAQKAKHGNGNGRGKSLHVEAARLLPTPNASDWDGGRTRSREALERGDRQENLTDVPRLMDMRWGQYDAAIQRWEHLTRPAPAPTETGPKGNPRLSARFSEWMMGLPAGWVTDVPGITRNEALKALGNGVVPAQAAAALRWMLAQERAA
jgi:DNA (cytosine-5)-methyltransferase 1